MKDGLKLVAVTLSLIAVGALFSWEPEHVRRKREADWKAHDETTRLELELRQAKLRSKIHALRVDGGR